jgi:hypothetical protein
VSNQASLSSMELFTCILIIIVASLGGVEADVTVWKTSTETAWSTQVKAASTVWNTKTYTETEWSTYIPAAVTVNQPTTVTVKQPTTVTVNQPTTVTVNQPTTVTVKQPTTVAVKQPTTVTVNQPTTVTIPPSTVTAACTTSSLSGIVFCSSRIVNPTYTTSTPLPDDYTWGCPPGTLCTPPQVGCNFEQNPPADTYYCSPDECVPVPPLSSFSATPTGGGNCGPYLTASGYFNFNPTLFGLPTGIFTAGGDYAENCSPSATSTLSPVSVSPVSVSPVSVSPVSVSPVSVWPVSIWPVSVSPVSVWPVSEISYSQPQAPTLIWKTVTPVTTFSHGQPQASGPSTTWEPVSTISDGQPHWPVITSAAKLAKRQPIPVLPQVCYSLCNQCGLVMQHDGKQPTLCPSISSAYGQCNFCLSAHLSDTRIDATAALPTISQFISYCNGQQTNAVAQSTTPSHSTTTAPPTPPSTISTPIPTTISTSAIATFTGAASHAVSLPSLFWSSPMGWALLLFVNALPL